MKEQICYKFIRGGIRMSNRLINLFFLFISIIFDIGIKYNFNIIISCSVL